MSTLEIISLRIAAELTLPYRTFRQKRGITTGSRITRASIAALSPLLSQAVDIGISNRNS